MKESDLCIYIGPPKTPTTFLQNEVLGRLQSHSSFVLPSIEIADEDFSFDKLFYLPPVIWREVEENPFVEKGQQMLGDTIVSDEGIFGGAAPPSSWMPNPRPTSWIPGFLLSSRESDPAPWVGPNTWEGPATLGYKRGWPYSHLVSRHLKELGRAASNWGYGRVRVLLTTRRQDTWLASEYA